MCYPPKLPSCLLANMATVLFLSTYPVSRIPKHFSERRPVSRYCFSSSFERILPLLDHGVEDRNRNKSSFCSIWVSPDPKIPHSSLRDLTLCTSFVYLYLVKYLNSADAKRDVDLWLAWNIGRDRLRTF